MMALSSGVVVVIVVALGGACVVAAATAAVRCLVSIVACVGKCGCGRWTRRKQRLWLSAWKMPMRKTGGKRLPDWWASG